MMTSIQVLRHGPWRLLCAVILLVSMMPARASIDFSTGSLYRSAGVPAWSPASGVFTLMLWAYLPNPTGINDFFKADDGGPRQVWANIGTASDSPTEPYFYTANGEWHFNKDGTFVANPPQSFDVSAGWTFLAVSFTQGGALDLYAWQGGVNGGQLVHIPVTATGASIGGSGTINTFNLGAESGYGEGCTCLVGPVYIYDGVAMTQAQIDAQRQQLDPVTSERLIEFSTFTDPARLAVDESGTADWTKHGTVQYNNSNPAVAGGTSGTGGSSSGGGAGRFGGAGSSGGAMNLVSMLALGLAAWLRRRG
ncbi:MAG TPA: GlyGly-CTERM sorting domain-containing protein [Nevskiaceae bacterium]|nr:GlyGly-CTERM sorting domain-containing protein [Nevskiaceae bacterium]